jgi:hypothetical protein
VGPHSIRCRGEEDRSRRLKGFKRFKQEQFENYSQIAFNLAVLSSPVWLSLLMFYGRDETAWSIGLCLIIVAANLFAISRATLTEPVITRACLAAYIVKIGTSGVYLWLTTDVLNGADAFGYYKMGIRLLASFEGAGLPKLFSWYGTEIINRIAFVVLWAGPKALSVPVVVFTTLAFWGQMLFVKAFRLAFPNADFLRVVMLLLFLPSLIFWTATLGKDALIAFGLGLAAFGIAKITRAMTFNAYVYAVVGALICLIVRPHVAAIVALSLVPTFVVGRNTQGVLGALVKMISVPAFLVGTFLIVGQAQKFLQVDDVRSGVLSMQRVQHTTTQGAGSTIAQSSLAERLAMAPFFMFRPFPWEIHNTAAFVASLESLLLAVIAWRRRKLLRSLWRARRDPYVLFLATYNTVFIGTFALAFSNFGLIARERVMVTPFFIVIMVYMSELAPVKKAQPQSYPIPSLVPRIPVHTVADRSI